MDTGKSLKTAERLFLFKHYSIQRRLPLLICILLLTVVIAFSWMSYQRVRKASVESGKLRLQSLSGQLSNLFGQSALGLITATRVAANHDAIKKYFQTAGKDSAAEVQTLMEGLQKDSTWVLVELLNSKKQVVLRTGNTGMRSPATPEQVLMTENNKPDTGKVGKIYVARDSMFYPIVAAVTTGNTISGYIIRWRLMQTTQDAINRFSQLLGDGVTLYVGNTDGSLWSDLKNPVSFFPKELNGTQQFTPYTRPGAGEFYATTTPVNNTHWVVLTELSQQKVMEPASRFLKSAISTGLIVIVIGILLTWLISRSITKPLKKLTSAAAAIAGGDYSEKVPISSMDEMGQLARSFNIMTEEVQHSQKNLEAKVQQRTRQLEATNKELEAFSYSVSHDLRAPLRAINGYSKILKDDYSGKLDAEANRIIQVIISNAQMMGQLIDDLIAFSKINKRENLYHQVDMKKMAETCFREIQQDGKPFNYRVEIADLPHCYADGSLLKQVWMNLISNAIKYSSKTAAPFIEIGYKKENGNTVYFIRDNGVGFDMKYSHKLFGVFQRLHKPQDFEGTGIGLALVKRILEKQDAGIWAEAELNKGATFYFSLPDKKEEPVIQQAESSLII